MTDIRPGLPHDLRELNATLGLASNMVFDLHIESAPAAFDAAADAIYAAFVLARDLGRPTSVTGCDRHPQGAVDPMLTPGWSRCLICNTYRRRAAKGLPPAAADGRTP